jgi:hypothetical protein
LVAGAAEVAGIAGLGADDVEWAAPPGLEGAAVSKKNSRYYIRISRKQYNTEVVRKEIYFLPPPEPLHQPRLLSAAHVVTIISA